MRTCCEQDYIKVNCPIIPAFSLYVFPVWFANPDPQEMYYTPNHTAHVHPTLLPGIKTTMLLLNTPDCSLPSALHCPISWFTTLSNRCSKTVELPLLGKCCKGSIDVGTRARCWHRSPTETWPSGWFELHEAELVGWRI